MKERKSLVKNYKQLFSLVGVFMNKKIRTDAVSHLFEAILTLENEEECFEFFEDLCTVNELLSLSQRFEVASMLKKKDTYLKIAEKTGVSVKDLERANGIENGNKIKAGEKIKIPTKAEAKAAANEKKSGSKSDKSGKGSKSSGKSSKDSSSKSSKSSKGSSGKSSKKSKKK